MIIELLINNNNIKL